MFGMGFMEILLVVVVAIIALGPEKLPTAMVDIAKMFKKFKRGLDDAKSTLNEELKISEMKSEANKFKAQFEETKQSVRIENNLGFEEFGLKGDALDLKGLLEDDLDDNVEEKKEKKTKLKKNAFKTKKKKEISNQETKEETIQESVVEENNEDANKFKVNFNEEENKSENI